MDKILVSVAAGTLIGYVATSVFRPASAVSALDTTAEMFLQSLPWIVVSMFLAGLMAQFFDTALIARWLGRESGLGGIVIGAMLGMFGTGSRWAMYPLAAGLLAAEASPGAVFSFVTTWQLISLTRLPADIPFLGAEFTVLRAVVSLIIAIVGGILIDLVTSW